jgi:four helix bundle protein
MAGAKHFEELIAWQLADQLRVEVFNLTCRPAFARDLRLHSQTEDAANSVCRNISEGFGGSHAEFARFLRISRRSMNELQDAFRAAALKSYVTAGDLIASRQLMRRLYKALSRFIAYLDRTPDPPKPKRPKQIVRE